MKIGSVQVQFFFRLASAWIGLHYSKNYNAYCLCLIPFCVIRFSPVDSEKEEYLYHSRLPDGVIA